MFTGPAEGHDIRTSAKGRHDHKALARSTRQKPAGGTGHRPPWHPTTHPITNTFRSETRSLADSIISILFYFFYYDTQTL